MGFSISPPSAGSGFSTGSPSLPLVTRAASGSGPQALERRVAENGRRQDTVPVGDRSPCGNAETPSPPFREAKRQAGFPIDLVGKIE
jgi:hypothetical protein